MAYHNRKTQADAKTSFLRANKQVWKELRERYPSGLEPGMRKKYESVRLAREAKLFSDNTANADIFKSLGKLLKEMKYGKL